MGLSLITAPASEPVTLAEAKLWCKVDTSDDDALLAALIKHARQRAEQLMQTAIISQRWEQTLDAFPTDEIRLRRPPVTAIASVVYVDAAGATQTLISTSYTLDNATFPGWLLPAYGVSWPTTRDQANAVRIQFDTGYANAAAVPEPIRTWMQLTISFLYDNRDAFVVGQRISEVPNRYVDGMLDAYSVFEF